MRYQIQIGLSGRKDAKWSWCITDHDAGGAPVRGVGEQGYDGASEAATDALVALAGLMALTGNAPPAYVYAR